MAEYNESQINSNETERISAEQERVESEAQRQTNETEREARESTRQSNESARITEYNTFMTDVHNTEDERIANEQVRINAENIRMANEDERLRKEVERQNAEELRRIAYNSSLYGRMDEAEDKLNEIDSQLAHIENDLTNKINSMTLNIKDFGSKGDIITDTQAFKDALNFESDIINIFFPKGTYNIDLGEYSLPNKKIILHGIKGESVLNGNSNSSFIISNNIEINNLAFNDWNSNRILELNNEIDINISNCYFNKCKIVLYCNSTYKTNIIKQLTFKDNYLENSTSALRIGCLIESAIVENNTCINFSQTVFQVGLDNESKDDSYCLNFIGRNNIIKGLYAKESYRGFMLYAKHVILENNTIEDMKFNPPDFNGGYEDKYIRSGIYVRSSADYVVIKNNVFKNLSGWQIQIKDSYGYIYIEGNKVYADKEVEDLTGFHIAGCDTLYCLNNEFSEIKLSNIIHSGADNNYILNNRMVNSKCVTAIKVTSINSVIKNNHIEMEIPDGDDDYYNTFAIYNSIVGNGTINVSNNYIQNIGTNSGINFRGVRISYDDEYACKVLKVMNNTLFNVRNGIQLYSSSTSLAPTILQCIENTGIDILEKMVVTPTVDSKIHLIDNNYNK